MLRESERVTNRLVSRVYADLIACRGRSCVEGPGCLTFFASSPNDVSVGFGPNDHYAKVIYEFDLPSTVWRRPRGRPLFYDERTSNRACCWKTSPRSVKTGELQGRSDFRGLNAIMARGHTILILSIRAFVRKNCLIKISILAHIFSRPIRLWKYCSFHQCLRRWEY